MSKIVFDRVVIDGNGIILELRSGNLLARGSTLGSVVVSDVTGKRIVDDSPVMAEMFRLIGRHISELIEDKPKENGPDAAYGASPAFDKLLQGIVTLERAKSLCREAMPWAHTPNYAIPLGMVPYNRAVESYNLSAAQLEDAAKAWLRSIGVRMEP
jgi:hypothetical protein